MAKERKNVVNERPDSDEVELFGKHKTKAEIKADEKIRKAQERAALKEEMAARRKEARTGHPAAKEMLPVFIVCGIVVVLCALLLIIQFNRAAEQTKETEQVTEVSGEERDESKGYFKDVEVAPTLTDQGINAKLVEAYYTIDGRLCTRMILGNGTKEDMYLDSLEIKLNNGDGARIGGGVIMEKKGAVVVPAEGTVNYKCFISSEHLEITDDSLYTLDWNIKCYGAPVSASEEAGNGEDYDDTKGYFKAKEEAPELTEKGINANLIEAYYTKDGRLYLRLILGNGTKEAMQLSGLEINLWNGDEVFIGGGIIEEDNPDAVVPAGGTLGYTCFIAAEHLEITDDSLHTLVWSISCTGNPVKE